MAFDFFRQGHWVTTEDQYDRDRNSLGPFPTAEAACEWCDAYNAAQIQVPAGPAGASYGAAAAIGVWSLAWCDGYDRAARLEALHQAHLRDPAAPKPDAAAIARRHGARWEHEWRRDVHAAIGAATCWCEALRDGQAPEVDRDVLAAYLVLGLERGRALFTTPQHFGEASLARCRPCGGAVLHLLVEHEGLGDSIHHYYTPTSEASAAALVEGKLDVASVEAWVGLHAGIHAADGVARCYARAVVGYLGVDHDLR